MEVWRRAIDWSRAGTRCALVTVIATRGSSPRHPGAAMLVDENGSCFGTIGGGRIELEVTEEARTVASGGAPRVREHHLTRDLAMCCGGSMTLYIESVAPSVAALDHASSLIEERSAGALITVFGEGKRVEREVPAQRAARREGDRFVEPLWPMDRLVLFGAGHVARAIGPIAASVGFEIAMCDDDEIGALDPAPPWARTLVPSFELTDVERALGGLGLADYVLILTRDHAIDQRLLERLLGNQAITYLGMIGSMGKVGRFEKRLRAKGLVTDALRARLHAPIGLDIAAETPSEIAVAVVAELIALRNRSKQ